MDACCTSTQLLDIPIKKVKHLEVIHSLKFPKDIYLILNLHNFKKKSKKAKTIISKITSPIIKLQTIYIQNIFKPLGCQLKVRKELLQDECCSDHLSSHDDSHLLAGAIRVWFHSKGFHHVGVTTMSA